MNAGTSSNEAHLGVSRDEIGWLFVQEYYTCLNKDTSKVHRFYTHQSTALWGNEAEYCRAVKGQKKIHKMVMDSNLQDCKVLVTNIDCQHSSNNGIIIQVLGEQSCRSQPGRKFAQTFFLAERKDGYFILNDIFRYLKEYDEIPEVELQKDKANQEHITDQNSQYRENLILTDSPSATYREDVSNDRFITTSKSALRSDALMNMKVKNNSRERKAENNSWASLVAKRI